MASLGRAGGKYWRGQAHDVVLIKHLDISSYLHELRGRLLGGRFGGLAARQESFCCGVGCRQSRQPAPHHGDFGGGGTPPPPPPPLFRGWLKKQRVPRRR